MRSDRKENESRPGSSEKQRDGNQSSSHSRSAKHSSNRSKENPPKSNLKSPTPNGILSKKTEEKKSNENKPKKSVKFDSNVVELQQLQEKRNKLIKKIEKVSKRATRQTVPQESLPKNAPNGTSCTATKDVKAQQLDLNDSAQSNTLTAINISIPLMPSRRILRRRLTIYEGEPDQETNSKAIVKPRMISRRRATYHHPENEKNRKIIKRSGAIEIIVQEKRRKLSKNDDPSNHAKSTGCALCDKSFTRFLVNHYVNEHLNDEVYNARMSPEMTEHMRKFGGKQAIIQGKEISGYCPYCEEEKKFLTPFSWLQHITWHTGEFVYHCAKCPYRASSGLNKTASGCQHTQKTMKLDITESENLNVFVCNLCGYTQLQKTNIDNHLKRSHSIESKREDHYQLMDILKGFRQINKKRNKTMNMNTKDIKRSVVSVKTNDEFKKHLNPVQQIIKCTKPSQVKGRCDTIYNGIQSSDHSATKNSRIDSKATKSANLSGQLMVAIPSPPTNQSVPRTKSPIPDPRTKLFVENIGFYRRNNCNIYFCNINGCRLEFISLIRLLTHLRNHKNTYWSGFCQTCQSKVHESKMTLFCEMDHLETHFQNVPPNELSPQTNANNNTNSSGSSVIMQRDSVLQILDVAGGIDPEKYVKNIKTKNDVLTRREYHFMCGIPKCNYRSCSEDFLRAHVEAMHKNERNFYCSNCKLNLANGKFINADRIINHLYTHLK